MVTISNSYDDEIKKMVYEIHGDVKEINKHLENLNGKVARHEDDIGELDDKVDKNAKKVNIATGVALSISAATGVGAVITNMITV